MCIILEHRDRRFRHWGPRRAGAASQAGRKRPRTGWRRYETPHTPHALELDPTKTRMYLLPAPATPMSGPNIKYAAILNASTTPLASTGRDLMKMTKSVST